VLNYRDYSCRLPANGLPRSIIIFLHGIQSHAGWYEPSNRALSQEGHQVYFLDRRGSGLNEAARGDTPGYQRLIADVAEFVTGCREHWRTVPIFLAAISWGGKLAAGLELTRPSLVDGLIFLCPGFCPRIHPPLGERLQIAIARVLTPRRRFAIPLNDPELFTNTPQWQKFIRDDPLALREATARLLVASVQLDRLLRRHERQIGVPILLLLAGRDRIIDNARTRRLMERLAPRDLEVIEYPDAAHTLEFEPDPSRFVTDLQNWLERHCRNLR
jgi:alpha-beta hydrolase superfamily lysophospholipase